MEPSSADTNGPVAIFTIGFAGHSAEEFFGQLQRAGVRTLVDVRLNNTSQLAGFAKRQNLEYFLRVIAGIDYGHRTELVPTKDILDDYKKKRITWEAYEERFGRLLNERSPERTLRRDDFRDACLLCSEHEPEHCHRRLVAEYLAKKWSNVVVRHL